MKIPTTQEHGYTTVNGRRRPVNTYSYAALLTEKNGSNVMAVRLDYTAANKQEAERHFEMYYPEWNIRTVLRLSEGDFG